MSRKNLILIHRGPEYEADFIEIAENVRALDPDIFVLPVAATLNARVPEAEWDFPTLTVALCGTFKLPIKRGRILKCAAIDKVEQFKVLRERGLPAPPAMGFEFGMTLDPIVFGEFVILKPRDPMLMSRGIGIQVFRRHRAAELSPADFPEGHPVLWSKKGYIVQKFVYTGEHASTERVTTFLGEPILAFKARANLPSPALTASDADVESGDFTQKHDRYATIASEPDAVDLARSVAGTFIETPLLGIDFLRDARTGTLSVLEVNAGGNTWHFSSPNWAEKRAREPEILGQMKAQFNAFDTVARALVAKVLELAV